MTLKTVYDPKPIPIRRFDWEAYDDDTFDMGSCIGYGTTEQEAIDNLMEMIDEETDANE